MPVLLSQFTPLSFPHCVHMFSTSVPWSPLDGAIPSSQQPPGTVPQRKPQLSQRRLASSGPEGCSRSPVPFSRRWGRTWTSGSGCSVLIAWWPERRATATWWKANTAALRPTSPLGRPSSSPGCRRSAKERESAAGAAARKASASPASAAQRRRSQGPTRRRNCITETPRYGAHGSMSPCFPLEFGDAELFLCPEKRFSWLSVGRKSWNSHGACSRGSGVLG